MTIALEDLAMNAWPGKRVLHYDGWVLRFAGGYSRRANSVSLIAPSILSLPAKVTYCEEAYSRAGLSTIFKIAPVPGALELDNYLARFIHEWC